MQAWEAPSAAVAPHSRQKRWLAKPKRDGVLTDVVTMRGLSPSSVPAADRPRAGLGTFRDEPRQARTRTVPAAPANAGGSRGSSPGPALRTHAPLAGGQQVAFAITLGVPGGHPPGPALRT